ncbi:MAG: hypothetical protein JST49_03705 [Bacteroidetes bacterium]|nr:hypothetical protein [Bacteroidota bacterium]
MKENKKPTADKPKAAKEQKKGGVAIVKSPQAERDKKNAKRNRKDLSPDQKTITGDMDMGL